MSLVYEQASYADVQELVQLRLAYLVADFGALLPEQVESLRRELPPYLKQHLGQDLLAFVARDEHIVSCAWLLVVEKPPSPRFPHGRTGILFNVYTAPDYRHRGIASAVMRQLITCAHEQELDVIELNATDDGYPLYQSLGFADDSSTHRPMRMVL